MNLCKIKKALGDKYVLLQDPYDKGDYWIGMKHHQGGFIGHTIRTACPQKDGIVWTDSLVRIESDRVLIGEGDGYHRCFLSDPASFTDDELPELKEWLDKAYAQL